MSQPRTLFDKLWDSHLVRQAPGEPDLLYIDLHLVHEVTSPQAFDGLRMNGRKVRRPDLTVSTVDHNIATTTADRFVIKDPISQAAGGSVARQLRRLRPRAVRCRHAWSRASCT